MAEVKAWTAAELVTQLLTFPQDALIYLSTENHIEPLANMSAYANGAVSLDGDGETNYYPGRMPPNE